MEKKKTKQKNKNKNKVKKKLMFLLGQSMVLMRNTNLKYEEELTSRVMACVHCWGGHDL